MSDASLICFKAIATFTNNLGELFSTNQRPLKLYCHLLNKTTLSHDKAIAKHIDAFRDFCISNRDGITSKDEKKLVKTRVEYSKKVFIDFKDIFKRADTETKREIWKHLLTISALTDPAGKAKEILKQTTTGNEGDFLTNIIAKVEAHVDPNANPMEAVSSIMQSGVFTDLIGGMNSGLQDGSLDLGKLMGSVQNMVSALGEQSGDQEGGEQAMNMINTMMGNLTSGTSSNSGASSTQGMPDLAGMMGPLLAGLGGGGGMPDLAGMMSGMAGMAGGGNNTSIEEQIDAQVAEAKAQKTAKIEEIE